MRILVVGGGGREQALLWRMAQDQLVTDLFCAPGNAGTSQLSTNLAIQVTEIERLTEAAIDLQIDLVVVGPEVPLALGLVDSLTSAGVPAFGPTQSAARIESSKAWAKSVMAASGVATAPAVQIANLTEAESALESIGFPAVIKLDGLAAGKGVVIAREAAEALETIASFLAESDEPVLIEAFLRGPEVSVIGITDGDTVRLLPPACDYKRAFDGDLGPNTGGMGAYAPAPNFNREELAQIEQSIFLPVLRAMSEAGCPMRGALYAGLMLTDQGPMVLEFNARFGDPETEVILPLLEGDFTLSLWHAATGKLSEAPPLSWSDQKAVTVFAVSGGYPGHYEHGKPIQGESTEPEGALIFHAATRRNDSDELVTSGGRVLTCTGVGASFQEAHDRAYGAIARISFSAMQYRKDIAERVL